MNNYQQINQNQSVYANSQQGFQTNNQDWERGLYQTHADPYNYPPMNRKDLMNLQTIQPYENGFLQIKNNTIRDYNLNTQDIRGAQPKFKIQQLNKPDLFNVQDIDGSQSKPHIQFSQYNKVSHILDHDDIKGSHPNINKFYTKREPFNPLEPEYRLQEAQQIIVDPPKFLRDTLNIDDIDGARARKQVLAYDKNLPDIEGAQSKKKFYPSDYVDSLNVRDINNKKQAEQLRNVNPLNPIYQWQYDETVTKSLPFGQIDGTNSRQLHKEILQPFDKHASSDIKGAQASSLVKRYNMNHRYAYSNQDIEGSQAGSRKIGIQTNRNLNPLRPEYQFLGRNEADNPYGGLAYDSSKQQKNIPRSQLAASASQNLIRAHQLPPSQQQQQQQQQQQPLNYSQSVSQLPPRDSYQNSQQVLQNQRQQLPPQNQQQGYYPQNNNTNQREVYQNQFNPAEYSQNSQVYSNPSQSIDAQLHSNQVPQMFYQSQNNNNNNNGGNQYS